VRTRRRFGQHFLEAAWVDKLIGVVAADASDTFIEIGAGRGALTRPLAARARHVVAIEVDRDLAAELARSAPSNLRLVVGDVLESDLGELLEGLGTLSKPARVAGNLPYNISTPIIFKLLSESREGRLISDATLMLQAEVADRLQAAPGSKEYGVLGILVRLRADVDRLLELRDRPARRGARVRHEHDGRVVR
jgi:16S rRNA (adenine1518-N6/adenine1519-N6)-dimethyltransferase